MRVADWDRTTLPGVRPPRDGELVPHIGFEPMISALRGRCPGPLDECGTNAGRDPPRQGGILPADRGLEPVRLEKAADRVGDLAVALLAEDEPVVGMCAERLELGIEPGRETLA